MLPQVHFLLSSQGQKEAFGKPTAQAACAESECLAGTADFARGGSETDGRANCYFKLLPFELLLLRECQLDAIAMCLPLDAHH